MKLVLLATIEALWTVVTLLIKHTPDLMWKYMDVEIYVQGNNYAILAIELQKQLQLFCLKSFVLVIQAKVLI